MKSLITILSLTIVTHSTFLKGQQLTIDSIVGSWTIYRHTLDSNLIFDADNSTVMLNYNIHRLKKFKPEYTLEDSVQLVKNVEKNQADMKRVFMRFNKDGTYVNTKIKGGGKITNEIEGGTYKFIEQDQTIVQTDQTGRIVTMKVSITNNILRLVFTHGLHFELEYKKNNAR